MNADPIVPAVRTSVSIDEYARAVLRAWHVIGDGIPSRHAVGVLWAQYIMETGGSACWNWNIGNTKEIPNDGIPYQALRGVWEGKTPAEAERLIASGQARRDTNPMHQRQVGPNRVAVVFEPPHPATFFTAFPSLEAAMKHHLRFLRKKFASAWPFVLAGDVGGFARALKAGRYFSATAEAYEQGMTPAFRAFVSSPAYDAAKRELVEETPTLPDLSLAVPEEAPTTPDLPVREDDGGASRHRATMDAVAEMARRRYRGE